MKNYALVTGANGFIGSRLTARLRREGKPVYILVRQPVPRAENGVKVVLGDILDPSSYMPALRECDTIFHCAAYISFDSRDRKKAYDVNVEGTRRILQAARLAHISKFVHLSAGAVLGSSRNPRCVLDESSSPRIAKRNTYAYTKWLAEEAVRASARMGLSASIANISTVYGPGDKKMNSGSIIRMIYNGKIKLAPPGGTSYVSVDDLVEGLLLLSEKGKPGERYILSAENLTYQELVARIAKALNVRGPKLILPRQLYYPAILLAEAMEIMAALRPKMNLFLSGQILKESFRYKYFSSRKAEKELGWHPEQTFEEAITSAFEYYRNHGMI